MSHITLLPHAVEPRCSPRSRGPGVHRQRWRPGIAHGQQAVAGSQSRGSKPMLEPYHPPPPCGEAKPLTRDMRVSAPAALTGNDGTGALPAVGSHHRLALTLLEADA